MRPDDEAEVSAIAYATGFFGESADRYFPARRLFGRLWVTPYLRTPAPLGYVATNGDAISGYIIGSASWESYHRGLLHTLPVALGSAWPPAPLRPSVRFLLRVARYGLPHADPARYPAHLHLNLLASARGQRLGERLLAAYLERLQALGVGGVQLSTTTENVAAMKLYGRSGFEVLREAQTPLWTPYLGRPTTQVVMGRRL